MRTRLRGAMPGAQVAAPAAETKVSRHAQRGAAHPERV